jgi:hypothetical protein
MSITKIIQHHFGGTQLDPRASTQNLPESHIENAHKARKFPISKLTGSSIGYTIVLWPDGWKQYRYIGEETAGAKGHNFDALHMSMAGNFMKGVDKPTARQLSDEKLIIRTLMEGKPEAIGLKVLPGTKLFFNAYDIGPHRKYAPPGYTQCNGDIFDDNRGKRIALQYLAEKYGALPYAVEFFKKMIAALGPAPLAGQNDYDDEGVL